jgi:hypothetical protein
MSRPLRPAGLALLAAAALASAACSQAPSKDAPQAAAGAEMIPASANAVAAQDAQAAPSQPELIRVLAAAPEGLSLDTPEGQRLFETVYKPDDCGDLGPDSEGPELPFDRYCVWPRDPATNVKPRVLAGIVDNRIVSVALIQQAGALPDWRCSPIPMTQGLVEGCVAKDISDAQASEWDVAWYRFFVAFVDRR